METTTIIRQVAEIQPLLKIDREEAKGIMDLVDRDIPEADRSLGVLSDRVVLPDLVMLQGPEVDLRLNVGVLDLGLDRGLGLGLDHLRSIAIARPDDRKERNLVRVALAVIVSEV